VCVAGTWSWCPAAKRGAARCASQVLDRDAETAARGAATLLQEEKNNLAGMPDNTVNITGFICTGARQPSRRFAFNEFE
jgi:hypothetical protein